MKRLLVVFLSLLVFCSTAFCLAPLKGFSKTETQSKVADLLTEQSESKKTSKTSETTSTSSDVVDAEIFKALEDYLSDKTILLPSQKEELKGMVEEAIVDASALVSDLKKDAYGTKFFADLGAAFGFKKDAVQYGIVGDMGLKFGKGFLTKIGVQYMLGDIGKFEMPKWSLEDMTVQATIGWEW